jgi:hypothetical protein
MGFSIFNFTLEYLKDSQSFELLHAKMNPTSLAGALLFDEKIRQSAALF